MVRKNNPVLSQINISQASPPLTFKQNLLLICYLFETSGFYYRCGDMRSLMDIIQRNEDDWNPRIGTEAYANLQAEKCRHEISWDAFAAAFTSQTPCRGSFTIRELRMQLQYLLREVERHSDQPLDITLMGPGQAGSAAFTWEMNLVLLGGSCAVMPFHSKISWNFWDPKRHGIEQMAGLLNLSPLFAKVPLTVHGLESAIERLGPLLCAPQQLKTKPLVATSSAQQTTSRSSNLIVEARSLAGSKRPSHEDICAVKKGQWSDQ